MKRRRAPLLTPEIGAAAGKTGRSTGPGAASISPPHSAVFRRRLFRWFDANKRDLPWRRDRHAYRIWVSEIMLQQTQVKTVLPYYEKFLQRFPDIRSLACAPQDQVVAQWSGLGYYGRARRLHEAAIEIERGGGVFPRDFEAILRLPGVGRYTAGAIASIAFGERRPVVDGNVQRFFSRYFGAEMTASECWTLAGTLLPNRRAGDYNQALMELGATVCRPHPACGSCPVVKGCLTRGTTAPRRRAGPSTHKNMVLLLIGRGGRFWMEKRSEAAPLLKGLWCLPLEEGTAELRLLQRKLMRRHALKGAAAVGYCAHSITRYRFRILVVAGSVLGIPKCEGRWFDMRGLDHVPHSSLVRKALELAGSGRGARGRRRPSSK